jgi:transposase
MALGISDALRLWSLLLELQQEAPMTDGEIVAQVERRRRKWTAEAKAALLAEVEAEGGSVTIVARRHRLAASVLYNWRAAWKAAATMMPASTAPTFIPLGRLGGSDHREPALQAPLAPKPPEPLQAGNGGVGAIEIVLANGARLRVDASVNEAALSRVLRAMRAAP